MYTHRLKVKNEKNTDIKYFFVFLFFEVLCSEHVKELQMCHLSKLSKLYTALQKFGNALEKWGFGRYHTSKHTSKLDPKHTSKLDPKHTSKLCYLERKQSAGIMSVMEWPPQSRNLNPIELLGTGPWCP